MAWLTGLNGVESALDRLQKDGYATMVAAAEQIAILLESYAKLHHGHTPREGRWVYPGGGVKRRWREAGEGWGDVTGNTNNSIKGQITEAMFGIIRVTLSAGMAYDVFLELARNGEWAWLWPAIEDNLARITAILAAHGLALIGTPVVTVPSASE